MTIDKFVDKLNELKLPPEGGYSEYGYRKYGYRPAKQKILLTSTSTVLRVLDPYELDTLLDDLIVVCDILCPNISYSQFKTLIKLVKYELDHTVGYYDSIEKYVEVRISVKELYEKMKELELI